MLGLVGPTRGEGMKHCSRCGAEFQDALQHCPVDGEFLLSAIPSLPDDSLFSDSGNDSGNLSADFNEAAPRDPVSGTTVLLDLVANDPGSDTSQMADEIDDLIFKVCSNCHADRTWQRRSAAPIAQPG